MGNEIERKFLVCSEGWRDLAEGRRYRQGYLSTHKARSVRVRTIGEKGYLTIKGPSKGITRAEFEYEIPLADANAMLDTLCERPLIDKIRFCIPFAGLTWEVDEFFGENAGLVVAEVELGDEAQRFERPAWVGREVSDDPRYFNASLIANPYQNWADNG